MQQKIRCLIVDDELSAREVLETLLEKVDSVEILGSVKNAMEAFDIIRKTTIDILFLDISMPEITGLDFAKSLNDDIRVVFTTAFRKYAVEGFELEVFDYLLKPISFPRLMKTLQKFERERAMIAPVKPDHNMEKESGCLFVRSDRKMVRIDYPDILYIESTGDYLKFYLEKKTIVTRETLAEMVNKLPASDFLRTHRSFLVSLQHVQSYTSEFVEIPGKAIPISRSYREQALRILDEMGRL